VLRVILTTARVTLSDGTVIEANDIPLGGPTLGSGIDSAATALCSEFSTQQGEWPYDKAFFGFPYRQAVFGKFFDSNTTASFAAAVANRTPDIEPVTAAQITIDTTTNADARQADITIANVTVDGEQQDLTLQTTL
jgi:hypothetical protein